MKKTTVFFIMCILGVLLVWRVYGRLTEEKEEKRRGGRAVAVEVNPVKTMSIRDVRAFTGTLRANSEYIVAPKIGGRLEKLTVNIGDSVKRGQLVAQLEDDEYVQQVEQAKAELEVVKARTGQYRTQLDLATREFDRAKELRQKKISSQAEYDSAESEYKTRMAELKVVLAQKAQKEAALRSSQVCLGYTRIHTVWQGGPDTRHVGERFVDEGAMLKANTSIFSIVEIKKLRAIIHITEQDYPRMRVNQNTIITTDAFPGETFTGTVLRIAKILKETSREARVEIAVPNSDMRLKPGMFARVQVEFASEKNATVVPRAAIVTHHGKTGVFQVASDGKKVKFVPIKSGIQDGPWVQVLSPKLAGRVVTLGQHLLRDGSQIVLPVARETPSESKGSDKPDPQGAR